MYKNKRIVKILALFLVFASTLTLAASCKSDESDDDENKSEIISADRKEFFSFNMEDVIDEEFYNIEYYNDKLYVLCDGKIYVLSMPPDKVEIIAQMELPKTYDYMKIQNIPSNKNKTIYLADIENRSLDSGVYDLDSHVQISDEIITFARLPDNIYAIQSMSAEDTIAAMVSINCIIDDNETHDHDGHGEVWRQDIYIFNSMPRPSDEGYFSLSEKIGIEISCNTFLNDGRIAYFDFGMGTMENNVLYILSSPLNGSDERASNIFNLYDTADGANLDNKKLASLLGAYHINDIFYDDDGHIWYFNDGKICHYSMKENKIETFYDITYDIPEDKRKHPCNDIYIAKDKVIATHYASKMVYVIAASKDGETSDSGTRATKILVDSLQAFAVEDLASLINETYGMKAEITTYFHDRSNDKIALKLLAGDTDFDIYVLESDIMPHYAKNSACYDLSSEKAIVDSFSHMFDGIKGFCSVGGKLCGAPLFANANSSIWRCNAELAGKLGIDVVGLSTEKMTWDDFYGFAVETKNKADTLGIENFSVFSYMGLPRTLNHNISAYMTNYLDYANRTVKNATDSYAGYLNLYIKMLDEGLIQNDNETALFDDYAFFNYLNCDTQIFPAPLMLSDDSYLMQCAILAINPNSPNIGDAIKYLECSVSLPILQRRTHDYLLKDWDLYEYYNPATQAVEKREANTNGHEVIAFIMKNGKGRYYNWDIFDEMSSDIRAIMDYTMSVGDYARKLYEKSKMIIEE